MPETPNGIIYPDASAHTRLWEHFQALADSVDTALGSLLSPSVSTSLPASSGWTVPAASVHLMRMGAICVIRFEASSNAPIAAVANGNIGDQLVAGPLPADMIPPRIAMGVANSLAVGASMFRVDTSGQITLATLPPGVGLSAGVLLTFSAAYSAA